MSQNCSLSLCKTKYRNKIVPGTMLLLQMLSSFQLTVYFHSSVDSSTWLMIHEWLQPTEWLQSSTVLEVDAWCWKQAMYLKDPWWRSGPFSKTDPTCRTKRAHNIFDIQSHIYVPGAIMGQRLLQGPHPLRVDIVILTWTFMSFPTWSLFPGGRALAEWIHKQEIVVGRVAIQ